MQLEIVCVGKIKEPGMQAVCREYEKRIGRYHKLRVIELADAAVSDERPDSIEKAKAKEAARILPYLDKGYNIALCLTGKQPDSVAFSAQMAGYQRLGQKVRFIIGGSYGLDETVIAACREKLCISKLTFPHNLARLVLLEQVYRAAKIANNETYHK